jgi:hypothetical protein
MGNDGMTLEQWRREEESYKGDYGNYHVRGVKYIGPGGEVGWHTTSNPHGNNPFHDFWIANNEIRSFILTPFESDSRKNVVIGEIVENFDAEERQAVLDAIADWRQSP